MAYYKVELLRRNWKKGLSAFLQRGFQIVRSMVFARRFDVFVLDCRSYEHSEMSLDGVHFSTYRSWVEMGTALQEEICRVKRYIWWDTQEWLSKHWQLRIGTMNSRLAIISWTRTSEQSTDFFFPLTSNCALIWETVTMPEFRGKGIYPAMLQYIIRSLSVEGIERIYISCRDYNSSSKSGIERVGFRRIGCGKLKRSGRHVWIPDP